MNKEIKAWVYDPSQSFFKQKKSEKAIGHVLTCSCPEKCELYKKNNCLLLNSTCPYGGRHTSTGFSRMAMKYRTWINEFKENHKEACDAKLTLPKKMEYFMDLVYIPISFWNLNEHVQFICGKGFFTSEKPVIYKKDFTPEFISEQILNFKPYALFGGQITDYQEKEIPKFLTWLKQLDPDLYRKVKTLNPDHPAFNSITNVGRRAVLQTLNPNTGTFTDIHGGTWTWDGEYIYSQNSHFSFTLIDNTDTEEIRLKPNKNAVVRISDENQVNDTTEFID